MSTHIEDHLNSDATLQAYARYPFESDDAFQQGMASILANDSGSQNSETVLRAKVFYFNKITDSNLTVDDVKDIARADTTERRLDDAHAKPEDDTRVLTLAELKELIESGKTDQIPNNKVIPDVLNTAEPSHSATTPRKKPWEIGTQSPSIQDLDP